MDKKSSKQKAEVSLSVTQLDEKDTFQVQAVGTPVDNLACLAMAVSSVSAKSGLSVPKILAIIETVLSSNKLILGEREVGKQKEIEELAEVFANVIEKLFGGK